LKSGPRAPSPRACYVSGMPKRSRKMPSDPNQLAHAIVNLATSDRDHPEATREALAPEPEPEKNPAAVALGRLGGAKGGPARAKALSRKRRAEIAKKAAMTRWGQKK
jgi:hypothetical protein